MTADPQLRIPNLLFPTELHDPVPETFKYRVSRAGPAQNTLPLGAANMNG
jgi:hypothetical protein